MVEALHKLGTNFVRFQIDSEGQRWYIVGCYLTPDDVLTILPIVMDIFQCYCGTKLLVEGEFNSHLYVPDRSKRYKDITVALAAVGLEEILEQFLPRQRPWDRDRRTWSMVQSG